MSPSTERKSITVVSSARNAVTLLKTVPISLPKLFVSYSTFNILPCYLRTKMLNQTFLNNQNKMTKLLSSSQNLQILRIFQSSLQFKMSTMFPPFPDLHSKCQSFLPSFINLFLSSPYNHLSHKFLEFCLENHSQFHHPSPLWKNEQFFIHVPFKLNKDINPTKTSHPGMSPSDFSLAKQECSQLFQQGLIETTDSDWAYQAFYVEKCSELVCGKKRLIIDYQPLNSFLKDDKFPLPKIQTLFVHLQRARIFSKFDLKAGFWQLGISPVNRHKNCLLHPWCPLSVDCYAFSS